MGWTLLKSLGSGLGGEVFEARTPEGAVVAVKLLSNRGDATRAAFEAEFELLARIRHPSIVSVLGFAPTSEFLFGEDRGPCFWMERIDGADVIAAARASGKEAVLGWFREALEALAYLHGQGVIHGDLSPGNLLVDSKSRLRLVDFGLSGFQDAAGAFQAATLPYTAPERLDGVTLPASDLFALGTVFYEALAGRHPRAGGRSLREILEKPVRPLATVVPDLSGRSEAAVVDRLIEPELGRRLSSASAALEVLSGGRDRPASGAVADYHPIRMIGAERALQVLRRSLKTLHKRPALLAVHGITGVGKSRFLREIALQCAVAGTACRHARPKDIGRTEGTILLSNLHALPPEDLLPLVDLEKSLAPGRLVVLEWNDDRLPDRLRPFFRKILENPLCEEIALKNLDRQETSQLLRNALGEKAAGEALEDVFRETRGNPLLLVETANVFLEERRCSGREFSKKWLKELPRLASFDSVLLFRLETLTGEDRAILNHLALAGGPVALAVLAHAVGDEGLAARLPYLLERELVVREALSGKYAPATEGLAAFLRQGLSTAEARKIHEDWFRALEAAPADDAAKLHHAAALGERALVAAGARPAAERLSADGRKDEALALIASALPFLEGDRDETSRLLRLKMNCLNDLGRFEAALEVAEDWFGLNANDEPAPLRAVKYWFITGLNHQNIGDHGEAALRLQRCLEAGDASEEAHRPYLVRAHSLLGAHDLRERRRFGEARRHFEEGLALAGPGGRRRAEICRHLAELGAQEGRWDEAKRRFEEAERLYAADAYGPGTFAVGLQQGNLALDRGDFETADASYRLAEAVARGREDALELALVQSNQAVLERRRGHLAPALPLLARAHDVFQVLGNRKDLAENLKRLAIAEASLGRFARAETAVAELREAVTGLPDAQGLLHESEACLNAWKDGGRLPDSEKIGEKGLEEAYARLPPELQVTFANRSDVRGLPFLTVSQTPSPSGEAKTAGGDLVDILSELAELNRELVQDEHMDRVLKRLMDAAMDLSRAESGFLLVQNEKAKGPIPGFQVAVSKKIAKRDLERPGYALSLSSVRRAMQSGEAVITDNAVEDPRFREAKSVHFAKLKSILAIPVTGREGVLGVFYLDHRYERGLFEGQTLAAMKALAGVAALALEKVRKIAALSETNDRLAEEVEVRSSEMGLMNRELQKTRLSLKNEYGDIVGRSPQMLKVLSLVDRITEARVPVWIYGESGTGKEAIARALHFNSARSKKAFVTENCASLPETLLESELFGHKKGSFTHATADKKGLLQYADGGTVFLDEIADMSVPLQAKLLRFLQEGDVRPIGSNEVVKVDVRVVSASNKDLHDLVRQGKFREDLFFRLNGVTVTLPPLRERLEDLPLLADHFLGKIAGREKKPRLKLSPEALKIFLSYDWPGNIRELQNTLETAALFAEKGAITASSLEFKPTLLGGKALSTRTPPPATPQGETELVRILRAIRDAGYHRSKAAEALGISRRNLYAKLEKFGVKRDAATLHEYIDRYL
ncbi:MAG TPA: sigma 54-interacting transcriptional regulator [bacterium]|nr:sigma 54-interacting transcriptional regulator [bacterium]